MLSCIISKKHRILDVKHVTRTLQDKEISKRIEAARFARVLRSRNKAKARRKRESGEPSVHRQHPIVSPFHNPNPKDNERIGYEEVLLPEVIDLEDNYDATVDVIRLIRRLSLSEKKPIYLVFDHVKSIKPAALLLLLAEMHRCRLVRGTHKVTGNYPASPKVERMLHATGFFRILGVKSRVTRKPRSYPMEYVNFVSQTHEVKGTVREFREALLGTAITMSVKIRGRFYRAITEAMLNVSHHAYPQGTPGRRYEPDRWWLAGHVNKKTKQLIVMFCDLGVGIPATLPKMYPLERIRSALSLLPGIPPNDAQMIKAGMVIGRTRTSEENRGRGLNDLRSFVDQAGEGELNIYSRRGHYCYKPNDDDSVKNHKAPIGGTLITWTVPLDIITNWIDEDFDEDDC